MLPAADTASEVEPAESRRTVGKTPSHDSLESFDSPSQKRFKAHLGNYISIRIDCATPLPFMLPL